MSTPNIDTITASLRSCSLGRRRRDPPSPPPSPPPAHHAAEGSDESAQVAVELNSETALPYPWEQYLDMRTGEVYYVNWETGVRTTEDPRTSAHQSNSDSDEEVVVVEEEEKEEEEEEDEEEEDVSDEDSGGSSYDVSGGSSYDVSGDITGSTSSPETSASSEYIGGGGQVLVAAGCKSCFTYFMVPKRTHTCMRCGGRLLHLGRSRNSFV